MFPLACRVIFKLLSQRCQNLQMERLYVTTQGGRDLVCLAERSVPGRKHMYGVSDWTDGQMDGWIHLPLLLGPGWPGSPGSMFPHSLGLGEQTRRHAYPFGWPQMPGVIICGLAWPAGPEGLRPPPSPNRSDRTGFLPAAPGGAPPPTAPATRMTRSSLAPTPCTALSVCPKGSECTCPGTSHPSPSLVPSEACSTLGATHPWPGFKELHLL